MLKKDEVSKYTISKNALDMLEWPPYSSNYTAKDIPMTDSNIQPPNPVPGTEETLTPGLMPETVYPTPEEVAQDYLAQHPDPDGGVNTTDGYVPAPDYVEPVYETQPSVMNTGTVDPAYASAFPANPGYDPTNSEPPAHPNSDNAHNQLMEDPKYAVHVHEAQLNRIISCLEEIVNRLNEVDHKVMHLEEAVRFDQEQHNYDGPPESPTGYEGTV